MNQSPALPLGSVVAFCALIWLYAPWSLAGIQFIEVTTDAGIADTGESVGAAWADVNADGYSDIWLDKHQYTPTVVYINRGDGTFTEYKEDFSEPWGLLPAFEGRTDSHGRAWADFDNDGDDDVLEVSDLTWDNLFWVNEGTGVFTDRMSEFGFEYPFDETICTETGNCNPFGRRMPLWLDYDRDGDLDVMVAAKIDFAAPYSPTALFQQTVSADGSPFFVYAKETGVDYARLAFCRYGVLAELSGDDNLDLICADDSRVTSVWDTSQLPFVEMESQLGAEFFVGGPSDLAVGDYDGDLRNDVFATRMTYIKSVADVVDERTLHARFQEPAGSEGELSFTAQGDLLVDFDWSTQVGEVFLGASGTNPPASADLTVYNGWNNHVQLRLSPDDAANHGIAMSTAAGTYIGFSNGRWLVRFVANDGVGKPQIAVQADVAISGLAGEGSLQIGQPASHRPFLFIQGEDGRLANRSDKIMGPVSSCQSVASGDFDNDGDLDVYAGCTGIIKNLDNILYENDGQGNFNANSGDLLGDARGDIYGRNGGVMTADYDNDGLLDLFVVNGAPFRPFSYAARQQLFRNTTLTENHWVQLDLQGTTSNRNGIGARIFAHTPDGRVQLREQGNGMHRDAQDFRRLHFGLGRNRTVDLQVRWPSGVVDHFSALEADQIHLLVEGSGAGVWPAPKGADLVGVWRPDNQQFYLDSNGNYVWDSDSDANAALGLRTDIPVAGNWSGNGVDYTGIWRPDSQNFFLDSNGDGAWDPAIDVTVSFGLSSDLPLTGDWNGDGADEIGVWRPDSNQFLLDVNANFQWDAGTDLSVSFGLIGDVPVTGDWNGDGKDNIGVWRPSNATFYLDFNGNNRWDADVDLSAEFGINTDVPLSGDWNGDGVDGIGVWRPDAPRFLLDYNENYVWESGTDRSIEFGVDSDLPLTGRW